MEEERLKAPLLMLYSSLLGSSQTLEAGRRKRATTVEEHVLVAKSNFPFERFKPADTDHPRGFFFVFFFGIQSRER
jgi:hypothetical protein